MPNPPTQKGPIGTLNNALDNQISDPRFANVLTDPRFRLPSRKHTHVALDKRFAHMLRDEDFSGRAKVDRYGRRLPKDGGRRELEKYYRIGEEGLGESGDWEEERVERELKKADEGLKSEEKEEVEEDGSISSSDDEESLDEDEEEEEVFGMLEEQEGGGAGIPKGEVTSRLAVVNLDWDNIRAVDLMAVFSSFVPNNGRILKITIYPSEFGRERMEREAMEGPPMEIFGQKKANGEEDDVELDEEDYVEGGEDTEDNDDDEDIKNSLQKEDPGIEFNSAKLRRYQLERLRYYYAVITCSSNSTAQAIYDAVDGTEYLTTANFFDLRYIPHSTDFSEDKLRDECDRIPDGYRPNDFVTDALQHSKVRLTWDADDRGRKEAQRRAFAGSRADIDENDLKAYLGSDSSGDDEAESVVSEPTKHTSQPAADQPTPEPSAPSLFRKEAERQKMRALLGLSAESAPRKPKATIPIVGDMQVTFSSGLTTDSKGSVFENTPEEAQETTVEKYVRKEKERKARRKEKLKAARNGTGTQAAKRSSEERNAESQPHAVNNTNDLGFNDPFFTFPGADDATASSSSKRKAERREKRRQREVEEAAEATKRAELELLMTDDRDSSTTKTNKSDQHFDIKILARAEKAAYKAGKNNKAKKRISERDKEALEMKRRDTFEVDVDDERFRDVFERAEFAIDPSHPRYLGTEGMRRLLEEGRRKKGWSGAGEDGVVDANWEKVGKRRKAERDDDDDDVEQLIKKVKRKKTAVVA